MKYQKPIPTKIREIYQHKIIMRRTPIVSNHQHVFPATQITLDEFYAIVCFYFGSPIFALENIARTNNILKTPWTWYYVSTKDEK